MARVEAIRPAKMSRLRAVLFPFIPTCSFTCVVTVGMEVVAHPEVEVDVVVDVDVDVEVDVVTACPEVDVVSVVLTGNVVEPEVRSGIPVV
jgi:hypothetical protein